MELDYLKGLATGGFNFDNCIRNKAMQEAGSQMSVPVKTMKTGTTICGIIYKVRYRHFHSESNDKMIGWCCACC